MYGSFGDAKEAFRGGKQKDTEKARLNKNDNKFRKKRRDRHKDSE